MSRLPRVFTPDLPNHIILRGNDRQDIVLSDADRRRILADLQIEACSNNVRIHAYALMTNHLHLMASADSIAAIPRAIQGLGRRYVSYFNLRHGRVGTLWQGRYRSYLPCRPGARARHLVKPLGRAEMGRSQRRQARRYHWVSAWLVDSRSSPLRPLAMAVICGTGH